MNKSIGIILFVFILSLVLINNSSALIIKSADAEDISPGQEGKVTIILENDANEPITDVSVQLVLSTAIPFTSVGNAGESIDEILDDDKEEFGFMIKSSPDAKPGDYQLEYKISYRDQNDAQKSISGTFGVSVVASPDLSYSVSTDTPVVGRKGSITFKVTNKGLADAKFVSISVQPDGYTLLSENDYYIGTISSDDFSTAKFDVLFNKPNPDFMAIVEYRDLDNTKVIRNIVMPLNVYTQQRALQLGIIQKNNTLLYISLIALALILFFVYRSIRKRMNYKKSRLDKI